MLWRGYRHADSGYSVDSGTNIAKQYPASRAVESARRVTAVPIKVDIGPRRPGDPASLYASPERIKDELGWTAKITDLDEIVDSAWRWFKNHPEGYELP